MLIFHDLSIWSVKDTFILIHATLASHRPRYAIMLIFHLSDLLRIILSLDATWTSDRYAIMINFHDLSIWSVKDNFILICYLVIWYVYFLSSFVLSGHLTSMKSFLFLLNCQSSTRIYSHCSSNNSDFFHYRLSKVYFFSRFNDFDMKSVLFPDLVLLK